MRHSRANAIEFVLGLVLAAAAIVAIYVVHLQ